VFRKKAAPWPGKGHAAGVSAFGFGGTNFHAVIQAHDEPLPRIGVEQWPAELVVFRQRKDLDALALLLEGADQGYSLREIAAGLARRGEGEIQLAFVVESLTELREKIAAARAGVTGGGIYSRDLTLDLSSDRGASSKPGAPTVALLFPGQGSQKPGMLSELLLAFPFLQSFLELDLDLMDSIYPPAAFDPETLKSQRLAVTDTRVAQPALGMVDLAAAALLSELGVDAQLLAGHSYGELVALCIGGVITPSALIALSHARADAILGAADQVASTGQQTNRQGEEQAEGDPGTMAAVAAGADVTAAALAGIQGVTLANFNSPKQTVIAGSHAAIALALARLEEEGLAARAIPVACAFHSPIVAAAETTLLQFLETLPLAPATRAIYSNTEAALMPDDPAALRALIARHVAKPVRFVDEIEAMYDAGARVFVEAGPGRVLTELCAKILGSRPHLAVALEGPKGEGLRGLLHALGELLAAGLPIDLSLLFDHRVPSSFDLDAAKKKPSPAIWKVNGHRAVPANGVEPAHGLHLVDHPLSLQVTTPAALGGERSQVMSEYLRGVREMASAQRDVLVTYLGGSVASGGSSSPWDSAKTIEGSLRTGATPSFVPDSTAQDASIGSLGAQTALEGASLQPLDLLSQAPQNSEEVLLRIVGERTGYPESMLELDLDLEADLSIDSIKRIEIIGLLAEALGLGGGEGGDAGGRDALVEELSRVKTLRGILEWLESQAAGAGEDQREPESPELIALPPRTLRFFFEAKEAPPLERRGSTLTGKNFVLHGGGTDLQSALRRRLEGAGAHVRQAEAGQAYAEVERVLLLDPMHRNGEMRSARRLFKLASEARDALIAGARGVICATDLGPGFGHEATHDTLPAAGVAGLFKTIAREWPEARVRCVHLDPRDDAESQAEFLHSEAMAQDALREVGWFGGRRLILQATPQARTAAPQKVLPPDSVVLITGGGRGITARLARSLAKEDGVKLILVGRSEAPQPKEAPGFDQAINLEELRRLAIDLDLAKSPKEAEGIARRILSDRELRETLTFLESSGCRFEYLACDVRDRGNFGRLIDGLYERYGKIDVVVHGAGVLEDKLLIDKNEESFARVVDTKVEGALTLEAHLNPKVKRVIFFGSVAGAFGNRGQADYAAANDVLDKLAQSMSRRIEGRAVSLDWGPWGGGGMVSEALEKEYARQGIGLIDPEDGVNCILEELASESSATQVLYLRADPDKLA